MALNLVADNRLAWQERKAESFTVSPFAAGTRTLGYRPIVEYGGPDGMSLRNSDDDFRGRGQSQHGLPLVAVRHLPADAAFNARLGAWLGNPGEAGRFTWRKSDPVVGAGPLLREMFGRTTRRQPVRLFVRRRPFRELWVSTKWFARRCRFIVVSDASCDADYAFEDLGNAIRKIRIDLGIRIEFPHGLGIDAQRARGGNAHGAIGVIRYADIDGEVENGTLVYLVRRRCRVTSRSTCRQLRRRAPGLSA